METWATFSIIDHTKPVYRQALALFDRIVVPIPPKPIGSQTEQELDQLTVEVEYLEKNQAAKMIAWDSDAFQEWRRPFLAEAAAAGINKDIFHDTRLKLAEEVTQPDVQAVPVYRGQEQFDLSKATLMQVEQALTMEVLQRLPVPDDDTPLENLIILRQKPAFKTALDDLLTWKRATFPAIALDSNRSQALAAAMSDFDKLTKKYCEAMEAEGFKKAMTVVSIFASMFMNELAGAIKETVVSYRETKEPSWKKLSEMKCAPAGVVYHFDKALA